MKEWLSEIPNPGLECVQGMASTCWPSLHLCCMVLLILQVTPTQSPQYSRLTASSAGKDAMLFPLLPLEGRCILWTQLCAQAPKASRASLLNRMLTGSAKTRLSQRALQKRRKA